MKVTVPQNLDIVDLRLRISFIFVDLYLKMVKSAQSQIHIQQQNNLDLLGTTWFYLVLLLKLEQSNLLQLKNQVGPRGTG